MARGLTNTGKILKEVGQDPVKSTVEELALNKREAQDFPGGPVVKTPRSQCEGPGFDPWSGN